MLRTVMIAGVVFVHAACDNRITGMGDGLLNHLMGFFNYAFFRASVPLLALISGYLLFVANLDQTPFKLWAKKAKTVALPFFVFNLAAIICFYELQKYFPSIILRFDLLNAGRYDWINAIFGVRDAPFNYPLYFMRDILALVALAPLFGWFIRTMPALGLVAVIIIFYFNFDSYLVIRSTSAIMFYVGGLLAVKQCDVLKLDDFAAPMLALFVVICLTIVALDIDDINYAALTGPFLIWPASKYLAGTKVGQFFARSAKYSFFIFIAHAPILHLMQVAYMANFQTHVPYFAFWLVAPTVIMAGLVIIYDGAMKCLPTVFPLAIGGRTGKASLAYAERRRAPRPAGAPIYSEEMRNRLRLASLQHWITEPGSQTLRAE